MTHNLTIGQPYSLPVVDKTAQGLLTEKTS